MLYVALLRGINVGGKNLIGMPALKACLEDDGFTSVSTYIQSGNLLFDAPKTKRDVLTRRVESLIEATFALPIAVVLRSGAEMVSVVADAPKGFGSKPSDYRYDVVFLKEPLTASAALKSVPTKDGVDRVWPGRGIIYYSRLLSRITQSHMSKMIGTPAYKQMTIRNWNTTRKLASLVT
jgi:uncharacterized protein (DUF1697 family)